MKAPPYLSVCVSLPATFNMSQLSYLCLYLLPRSRSLIIVSHFEIVPAWSWPQWQIRYSCISLSVLFVDCKCDLAHNSPPPSPSFLYLLISDQWLQAFVNVSLVWTLWSRTHTHMHRQRGYPLPALVPFLLCSFVPVLKDLFFLAQTVWS